MSIWSVIICYMTILGTISAKIEGWDTSPNTQYHIQTDEGPERYFKYQTISGQYRREKRLHDGSVVGSYGWVDADGFLRLNDYIADNAGYRITKAKKVYVGSQSSVDQAVALANKVPAQAGTEVDASNSYRSPLSSSDYVSRQSSYRPIVSGGGGGSLPGGAGPSYSIVQHPVPSSTASPPIVPPSTIEPYNLDRSKILIFPSSSPTSITAGQYFRRRQPTPPDGYYPKSFTAASSSSSSTTSNPLLSSSSGGGGLKYEIYDSRNGNEVAITPNIYYISTTTTPRPSYDIYSHRPGTLSKYRPTGYNSDSDSNSNSDEVDRNSLYSNYNSNNNNNNNNINNSPDVRRLDFTPIRGASDTVDYRRRTESAGTGYKRDDSAPEYDGVSVTKNGFRYYLPRHYHEEENLGDDNKAGSFGYIDPFGIRRVIYYNASPNSGFVHRKNNRYVGFNATPYDPRP